jgi:integrase
MVHAKKIQDQIVKEWLTEFKSKSTKESYLCGIRKFKKNLNIKDLDKYMAENPDATKDIKRFLVSLDGKPSKTVSSYVCALKSFFSDNNVSFDETQWKKMRRRGFMPKRVKAETRDKKPSKKQLKRILNYMDIKGRAQVLFLLSSGCRVGESLQLLEQDFDLEADPPKAEIRAKYTKSGVGARTVYFSYEARDAIKDWLAIRDDMKKRNGKKYRDNRVFSWSIWTARDIWNRATRKANLDIKDNVTDRRVYHLHSLRKFFRSCIGLDPDLTHALMGHVEYLDSSYLRIDQNEIAEAYLEAMGNVSIYGGQSQAIKSLEDENRELKAKLQNMEMRVNKLEKIESMYDEICKMYESFKALSKES